MSVAKASLPRHSLLRSAFGVGSLQPFRPLLRNHFQRGFKRCDHLKEFGRFPVALGCCHAETTCSFGEIWDTCCCRDQQRKIRRRDVYILRREHAGERGSSLARTDAAQIRRNVAFAIVDGPFERSEITMRTRELKRPK
jgi:hypothetical protein